MFYPFNKGDYQIYPQYKRDAAGSSEKVVRLCRPEIHN